MEFKKIKQLESEIESKSFYKSNLNKYNLWKYSSYLFQILNIVLCFFGLYLFLDKTVDNFIFKREIIGGTTIMILLFWEYLKRIQIRDLSIIYLKNGNGFNNSNLINLFIGVFLIVCSSLIAINGGNEISNKEKNVVNTIDNKSKIFKDSINQLYNKDIIKLQSRIDYIYENNIGKDDKKKSLTKQQEKFILNIDNKINQLKNERNFIISDYKLDNLTEKGVKLSENNKIVYIFVSTSLLFELIILIAIIFCTFFEYKSYYEIISTEQYRRQEVFLKYLNIIFDNGKNKIADKLDSESQIKEFIKIKYKNNDYFKDFFISLYSLKIIETRSDKRRYFTKSFEEAKKEINKQFEI